MPSIQLSPSSVGPPRTGNRPVSRPHWAGRQAREKQLPCPHRILCLPPPTGPGAGLTHPPRAVRTTTHLRSHPMGAAPVPHLRGRRAGPSAPGYTLTAQLRRRAAGTTVPHCRSASEKQVRGTLFSSIQAFHSLFLSNARSIRQTPGLLPGWSVKHACCLDGSKAEKSNFRRAVSCPGGEGFLQQSCAAMPFQSIAFIIALTLLKNKLKILRKGTLSKSFAFFSAKTGRWNRYR